jgi:hypothetical protein
MKLLLSFLLFPLILADPLPRLNPFIPNEIETIEENIQTFKKVHLFYTSFPTLDIDVHPHDFFSSCIQTFEGSSDEYDNDFIHSNGHTSFNYFIISVERRCLWKDQSNNYHCYAFIIFRTRDNTRDQKLANYYSPLSGQYYPLSAGTLLLMGSGKGHYDRFAMKIIELQVIEGFGILEGQKGFVIATWSFENGETANYELYLSFPKDYLLEDYKSSKSNFTSYSKFERKSQEEKENHKKLLKSSSAMDIEFCHSF